MELIKLLQLENYEKPYLNNFDKVNKILFFVNYILHKNKTLIVTLTKEKVYF